METETSNQDFSAQNFSDQSFLERNQENRLDLMTDEVDLNLLNQLTQVNWLELKRAVDLACGAGRIGVWLRNKGLEQIDGIDITPEMLERAGRTNVYNRLVYGDMRTTLLGNSFYDLVTNVLGDQFVPELEPLYKEVARILKPGGYYIDLGLHQYFLLNRPLKNYVHLVSDHFKAASSQGFDLVELDEKVVDEVFVGHHPHWAKNLNCPMSYVFVWRKRTTVS